MSDEKDIVTTTSQPLSDTAITEMTQREQWNKKHPATEATIIKDLKTTELVLYIVKGKGHTVMHFDGEPEERVDWEEGDLIGIPLWAWHQHFNDDDADTARYLAI